jgi:hypothetical protein
MKKKKRSFGPFLIDEKEVVVTLATFLRKSGITRDIYETLKERDILAAPAELEVRGEVCVLYHWSQRWLKHSIH